MWRIGGGCVPTWTSAGKAVANSDASAAIRRTTSASSRNAVFRQVCQPSKKSRPLREAREVEIHLRGDPEHQGRALVGAGDRGTGAGEGGDAAEGRPTGRCGAARCAPGSDAGG